MCQIRDNEVLWANLMILWNFGEYLALESMIHFLQNKTLA